MNCRKVQELLARYSLGELDPVVHRQIQGHLDTCPDCAQEAQAMKRDVVRISAAFKGQFLRPWRRWVWPIGAACAACALLLFAAFGPVASPQGIEAMALAEAPVVSPVLTEPAAKVAATLSQQTGFPVPTLQEGQFLSGACVNLYGKKLPKLVYMLDGANVSFFQVDASALRTSGMLQMERRGRKFYCCSRKGCAVVAFSVGGHGYVFRGEMTQRELAALAMRVVDELKLTTRESSTPSQTSTDGG